jgi:hypothetical protein
MSAPTKAPTATDPNTAPPRWRKELALAAIFIGLSLVVLPALIYGVGVQILGAYGGGPHIGSFYGDFFRNLIGGVFRTWFIVLAPYLFICVLRLIFWPWGRKLPSSQPGAEGDLAQPHTPTPMTRERREPFVAP